MNVEKFKTIFQGLDIAYGTYVLHNAQRDDGKELGQARVVRKPPTDDLWENHLKGLGPGLGIIPIRADNTCYWGAIDVDVWTTDHAALVQKIRALVLPLVLFRSKSGGAHLLLFSRDPIPAKTMQGYLRQCAAVLGFSGCEIFPKQSEILVDRGDTGNFLNLPYYSAASGVRYAFKDDGTPATLEEFYDLYETYAIRDGAVIAPAVKQEIIPDGPPCLQHLCSQGFPQGTRNNGLFNVGIYLKKAHPDTWEQELLKANQDYMNPPLGVSEISLLTKQLNKKEYHYKCKDAPINSHCNSHICRGRKFGIGSSDDAHVPVLSSLSKYNSEPPLWFLDIDGHRIEMDTETLYQQNKFQLACVEKLNILPPSMNKRQWEGVINELLKTMVEMDAIIEASDDASKTGKFYELLEEFCNHFQQALDREEILLGRPWVDEKEGVTIFRLKDLEAHMNRNKFTGLSSPQITQRLRDINGKADSISIKNRTVRVWKVPSFEKAPTDIKTPEFSHNDPF